MLHSVRRLHTLCATLLLVPVLLAGCGDKDPTGTSSVEGTYTLQQVNGQNVPATVYEDNEQKFEFVSGSLILGGDKRYQAPTTFRVTDKSTGQQITASLADTGTYSVSGSTLTFVSSDADVGTTTGSISGNTITYTAEGMVATYRK